MAVGPLVPENLKGLFSGITGPGNIGIKDFNEIKKQLQTTDAAGRTFIETLEVMKDTFKTLDKSILTTFQRLGELSGQYGLGMVMNVVQSLEQGFVDLAKSTLVFERRNRDLQKSLGLSVKRTAKFGENLDNINSSFKYGGIAARSYLATLNQIAPGVAALMGDNAASSPFVKDMLDAQHILQTQLGISEELSANYELYARTQGMSGKELLDQNFELAGILEKQGYEAGVMKTISEEILKLGADTQLQYGRIPGNLEMATLKARALNATMQEITSAGKNMLNIEESVGNELEYQMLTGHRLIGDSTAGADLAGKSLTSEMRKATVMGDSAKQASILAQIVEQEGDALANNLFAREAMAKLTGIEESRLAGMVQKEKLRKDLVKAGIIKSDILELSGGELEAAMTKIGLTAEEQLEYNKSQDTRTTEEILKQGFDLVNTTLMSMASGALGGQENLIVNGQAGILSMQNTIEGFVQNDLAPFVKGNARLTESTLKVMGFAGMAWSAVTSLSNIAKGVPSDARRGAQNNYLPITAAEAADDGYWSEGTFTNLNKKDETLSVKPGGVVDKMIDKGGNNQQLASSLKEALGNMSISINFDKAGLAHMVEAEIAFNNSQKLT